MDWFGSRIQRLINKEDLDRDTIRKMFTQVLEGEQPELQQGAFLAALAAKGETPEEIAGAWEAIREIDTIKVEPKVDGPILDNCGTGMDPLKTFNISTTASILAAAGGVVLARHGARSITSKCGTVDVAEALGVDVEGGVEVAKKSVEKCGLGLFNGMSPLVHPKGLFRILSQIRFGTTLNIAGSLASPILPHLGVRGVFSPEMVDRVAEVMREIGYKEAYVFHGFKDDGQPAMDEISNLGPTIFCRLNERGHLEKFILEPEELGVKRAKAEELAPAGSPDKEAVGLVRLLAGQANGARQDAVCLNTAPMFILARRVEDFKAGVELARELIFSGKGLVKLEEWVSCQNRESQVGQARFESVLKK
ncbi:MAG: anthranilate phosphoribosyltransferase, partial [Deltaproteobacteria bacterium]|nr:anthranilate phosphoribosyltransferase [Deltaproteobacteria bacterium]